MKINGSSWYEVRFELEMPSGAKHRARILVEGYDCNEDGSRMARAAMERINERELQTEDQSVAVESGPGCTLRILDVTEHK